MTSPINKPSVEYILSKIFAYGDARERTGRDGPTRACGDEVQATFKDVLDVITPLVKRVANESKR